MGPSKRAFQFLPVIRLYGDWLRFIGTDLNSSTGARSPMGIQHPTPW